MTPKMSRGERKRWLAKGPKIREVYNGLEAQHRLPRRLHKDVEVAISLARKFNAEVLKPLVLETDLKCMADHDYLPWDFVKVAGDWGLYSLFLPKFLGGQGLSLLGLAPFIEEVSSVCSGLGHVIFVHYLGAVTIFPSFHMPIISRIFRDVARSEREGKPRLIDLTITEPNAGSDVQEPPLVGRGRIGTLATKVPGGYKINGRKIFISNGHLSHWHVVMCFEDKERQRETFAQFVVPNGSEGFSFGRHEKKMGHLASTASELVFEDCFVPDDWVSFAGTDPEIRDSKKGAYWFMHSCIDFVTSSSRAGVGAIATGIGRNAYELALDHARKTTVDGDLLINHQWAQVLLADMYRNVLTSRTAYMESVYADYMSGLFKMLGKRWFYWLADRYPRWLYALYAPLIGSRLATKLVRKYYLDWYSDEEREISSGWASLAKYTCSDVGLQNAGLALDLMGADGLRHDSGAEKCYRDVKLQQIYESTNEINRLNLFYCMIRPGVPEVEMFK